MLRLKWRILVLGWILMAGCSTKKSVVLTPFQSSQVLDYWSATSYEKEWWYLTGWLKDDAGNTYFHQFTLFHGRRKGVEGYVSHVAWTDFQSDTHFFAESSALKNSMAGTSSHAVWFNNDSLINYEDEMHLKVHAAWGSLELSMLKKKPLVLHGNKGIISMGHEEDPSQNSAYFSYTHLLASGTLVDPNGNQNAVSGVLWFDRQFGNFSELNWKWYSVRLFDGTEYLIFDFPKTNFRLCEKIDEAGSVTPIDSFTLSSFEPVEFNGNTYALTHTFKAKDMLNPLTIRPFKKSVFNSNKIGPTYWEGLCGVYASNGELVGMAVVELTAP